MIENKGSVLSDGEIREALLSGEIDISGYFPLYVGPSSLDIHMNNHAKVMSAGTDYNRKIYVDKKEETEKLFAEIEGWDDITIYPKEFYILSSIEKVKLSPNISAFVCGRSSLARIGLNIHMAGFIDPGFEGTITLEVTNFTNYPIVIPRDTRIGQIVFMRTGRSCEVPYGKKTDSKYQGQVGPTLTKMHEDYDNKN